MNTSTPRRGYTEAVPDSLMDLHWQLLDSLSWGEYQAMSLHSPDPIQQYEFIVHTTAGVSFRSRRIALELVKGLRKLNTFRTAGRIK